MAITDFDSVFWTDPWMRKRSPHARYLFSYLFTGPHKNRAGIYPIDVGVISFETGMSEEKILPALRELEPKVLYDYELEIVYVTNHVRHQYAKRGKISPTIATSIVSDLNKLPQDHDFIDLFLEKYERYFIKRDTLIIPYPEGIGKGREGKDVKYNESFEKFWSVYPKRNGKKVGKPTAFDLFCKFPETDWPIIIQCAQNYSTSSNARNNYAKDPERFLKKDYWREWVEAESEPTNSAEQEKRRADIQRDIKIIEDSLPGAQAAYDRDPSADNKRWLEGKQRELAKLQRDLEG
jgi:hypothetical protein